MDEPEKNGEFKVTDKRRFTEEGQSKPGEAEPEKQSEERSATVAEDAAKDGEKVESSDIPKGAEESATEEDAPPLSFATFVLSLANTALFQLGLIRMPDSEEAYKDLKAARQTIDILAIMQDKTKGNLTDEEKRLIDETLYQLRMAFVEASK